jgi:hypothetical protein
VRQLHVYEPLKRTLLITWFLDVYWGFFVAHSGQDGDTHRSNSIIQYNGMGQGYFHGSYDTVWGLGR